MTVTDVIVIAAVSAIANGAAVLAVLKNELRHMRGSIRRAHKRLDLIEAPSVTE